MKTRFKGELFCVRPFVRTGKRIDILTSYNFEEKQVKAFLKDLVMQITSNRNSLPFQAVLKHKYLEIVATLETQCTLRMFC